MCVNPETLLKDRSGHRYKYDGMMGPIKGTVSQIFRHRKIGTKLSEI